MTSPSSTNNSNGSTTDSNSGLVDKLTQPTTIALISQLLTLGLSLWRHFRPAKEKTDPPRPQ